MLPFLKKRKHIILLTGTPALAKPKEIYPILEIIRPDCFTSFFEFGKRYCDPQKSRWYFKIFINFILDYYYRIYLSKNILQNT